MRRKSTNTLLVEPLRWGFNAVCRPDGCFRSKPHNEVHSSVRGGWIFIGQSWVGNCLFIIFGSFPKGETEALA